MENSSVMTNVQVKENDIKLLNRLLIMISVVLIAAAITGIIYGKELYPGEELYAAFLPNDILNLVLSLPALLISWWLVRQNRLAGLLCLPGVLFNVAYMLILNIIGLPLNFLFLVYILLLVLCIYTIIFILASCNAGRVQRQLSGRVREKMAAGIILFLGGFNFLYQSANAIQAVLQHTSVASIEYMLMVDDLAFNVPALLVGGILLLRRRPLGYVTAVGLLLQYALLAAGAMPALMINTLITSEPVGIADFVVLLTMVVVCCVPLVPFLKHSGSFTSYSTGE